MTREEAIARLKANRNMFVFEETKQALDMAIESLSANCTTEKPNDEVEQGNDVVAEPTDLISRAELLDRIKAVNSIPWGDDRGNAVKLVWSTEEVKRLIEKAPSADRPTLKQTDTMIIADALRYLMKDEERHLSDRTRADALREQFLNYGAKMGSD